MEWGPKEWIGIASLALLVVSAVIVVRERLTKIETEQKEHARRIAKAEEQIEAEREAAGEAREEMVRVATTLEGLGQKVLAMEGTLSSGLGAVLGELRKMRKGVSA